LISEMNFAGAPLSLDRDRARRAYWLCNRQPSDERRHERHRSLPDVLMYSSRKLARPEFFP